VSIDQRVPPLDQARVVRPAFLVHDPGDAVGVAVADLVPGTVVIGQVLTGGPQEGVRVEVRDAIPLGHKIALRHLDAGDGVVEYGEVIGEATRAIEAGEHVHIHNLRSRRWAR
jgi:(2R)-sulfolactate sulfo-lyase subunit alpha